MAQPKTYLFPILLLVLLAIAGATPPGIANNPSQARCLDDKYKNCTNIVHVCPKFCPSGCTVNCQSCKPVCIGDSSPPPPETYYPPTPASPPPPSPPAVTPTAPSPSTPSSPPSITPAPSPTTYTPPSPSTPSSPPSPPSVTPTSPPTTYNPPSPSSPPSPTPPSTSTPSPPPSPSPTPINTTPSSPSPPTPSSPSPTPRPNNPPSPSPPTSTVSCKNRKYPECYNAKHQCPSSCPGGCVVDCVLCKPVCKCDRPGAVCQDPRFIGGDGITFYFHGKRDRDFCLVSDSNLHINAHFIGRRNENMKRDFTWVQSIVILFDTHQLYLGAQKTSIWYDSIDRLSLTYDGEAVTLPEAEGAKWQSATSSINVSITRASETNNVVVEVEGRFKIAVRVVPITEEDSRIHNYGITAEDCFAHLDLGFKFYSLSDEVDGVLGQTYKPGYVSHVKIGAKMPVMGWNRRFETSDLFAADCSVARFSGNDGAYYSSTENMEFPGVSCVSGIHGRGVVCKR